MRRSWRRWLPGPKRGIARGTAAFGPSSDDPSQLLELLGKCEALRAHASERGIDLDDGPASLVGLDDEVDSWNADPSTGRRLSNEIGCYLGTVIVKQVPGAFWRTWPNGHPVVRLPSGRDLDVIAQAERRVSSRSGSLTSIFDGAR